MIIHMTPSASETAIDAVCAEARRGGAVPHVFRSDRRITVVLTACKATYDCDRLATMHGVEQIETNASKHKLSHRSVKPDGTTIQVGRELIGGNVPIVIAGPCAVESYEQMRSTADQLGDMGIGIMRGGAFKPRTSPYDFQGLQGKGLDILRRVRDETGMAIVTEAVGVECFDAVERIADIIQIGARNMHNVELLRRAGQSSRPILLKRHYCATLDELLFSAEYIMLKGNQRVILCERGIRAFGDHSRFTLDLAIVPRLKELTHLPVLVDPSHAAGDRKLVAPLARAALAVGADGVLIEAHPCPIDSQCDANQAIDIETMQALMADFGYGILAPVTAGAAL